MWSTTTPTSAPTSGSSWPGEPPLLDCTSTLRRPTGKPTTMGTASAHHNNGCVNSCRELNKTGFSGPCRFQGQAQSHAEVLGRFERDLRLLASVSILPAAQTQQCKCLGDLVPEDQYRDWAVKCSATHENLVKRVWRQPFQNGPSSHMARMHLMRKVLQCVVLSQTPEAT